MLRTRWLRTLLIGFTSGSWLVTAAGQAATRTWDGGVADDNNWSNAGNWDGVAPVPAADDLVFAGTNDLSTNNDFPANSVFNGLTFNGTAGNFTLAGNAMVLNGDINNSSGKAQIINFTPVNVVNTGLTYVAGGLVLDGATSNVNVSAGGSLSLGQVTFGAVPQSANVSTLNVNNSVSASGLTVQTNSAGINTINIAAGQTFTVNGGVFFGTPATVDIDPDVQIPTNVTFAGGGNLTTGGGNFFVGLGFQNLDAGDRNVARVDMTALNNFTYSTGTTGTGLFGVGWMTRPDGQLRLSNTSNTIVADVIGIGNSAVTGTTASPNNGSQVARLFLGGGTNVINADNINIGAVKGQGSIEWDPAVTTGTLTVAGQDGVSRANITIASQSSATGAGGASTLSLTGHSVNISAATVQVGRLAGATGGIASGVVNFDTGTFNVNSLQIAVNASGTAANGSLGVFNMGGGSLTVNNSFILANDTSTAVSGKTDATFNLNNGTVTSNAAITRVVTSGVAGDAAVLNINNGTLDMTGHDIGTAVTPLTAINLTGGNLTNAARIVGTAINVGATNITGTPTFVVADTGTLTSSLPTLSLASGAGIEGGGVTGATVIGDVVATSGSHIGVGVDATASTLTFANNLSLNSGSTVNLDLSDNPGFGNDVLNVSGNLTAAGTVNVSVTPIGAGATIGQTYTLINYTGSLTGNQSNFFVSDGTRKTYTVQPTAGTPNTIQALVGGTGPLNLTWIGNVNNEWDLGGDANWSGGEKFFNLDSVTFDNTSTNLNPVQLVGTLRPAAVTVDGTRNYTFTGSGSIAGSAALTKNGTGTLTVNNANSYTGGTQINDGVVEVGTGGSLGTGAVTNATTLRINRTDTSTFANAISGAGNVVHAGTGTTTLSGANTYTGTTAIQAGTVVATNNGSLGDLTGGAVTVSSGATLDIGGNPTTNNANFGAKQFNIAGAGVGGQGAIINSATAVAQQNVFQKVTLTADATVGAYGRFDLRNGPPVLDLAGFTLTKKGTQHFGIVGGTVTDGNIVVTEGNLALEGATSVADFATGKKITFQNGSRLQFFNTTGGTITRPMEFNGNVNVHQNSGVNTTSTFASPITLKGTATFTFQNTGQTVTDSAAISDDGTPRGIVVDNSPQPGTLVLTGDNTYTGNTTVNAGSTLTLQPLSGISNLGNSSTVSLATGALLNLNFTNTDTIAQLVLGGITQATGVWGAMGSGAAHESAQLVGAGFLNVVAAAIAGDYNNNGVVDAADYAVWRKNVGLNTVLPNDPTGGTIGATQYNTWKENFGKTPGSGAGTGLSGTVPEPGTVVLGLLALLGLGCLRSRGA